MIALTGHGILETILTAFHSFSFYLNLKQPEETSIIINLLKSRDTQGSEVKYLVQGHRHSKIPIWTQASNFTALTCDMAQRNVLICFRLLRVSLGPLLLGAAGLLAGHSSPQAFVCEQTEGIQGAASSAGMSLGEPELFLIAALHGRATGTRNLRHSDALAAWQTSQDFTGNNGH